MVDAWQVVLGAWNEQHCYPIANDFRERPFSSWYMGDIPHGWACAEFMLLVRDMLFFEADEDQDRHIYLAPGILPRWVKDGEGVRISNAPTVFGRSFGFQLTLDETSKRIQIEITEGVDGVRMVYPCRFGTRVVSAIGDGQPLPIVGNTVHLPAGTVHVTVMYE